MDTLLKGEVGLVLITWDQETSLRCQAWLHLGAPGEGQLGFLP